MLWLKNSSSGGDSSSPDFFSLPWLLLSIQADSLNKEFVLLFVAKNELKLSLCSKSSLFVNKIKKIVVCYFKYQ